MTELVLIGSSTSPFVRKCRIVASLLRVPFEFKLERQWSPDSQLLQKTPLSKVPVLVTPDLGNLFDSRVIVAELERRAGKSLRPNDTTYNVLDMRLEALGDGIGEATALVIQETWRPEHKRSEIWSARQVAKVRNSIETLSKMSWSKIPDHESPSVGQIAVVCGLDFVTFWVPEENWAALFPSLSKFVQQFNEIPQFSETRPSLPDIFKPPSL